MIHYLVVNTGRWLSGRKVLLSPFAVGEADEQKRILFIELTQEQIKNSPPIESDQPISREYEINYFNYYGWPPYWDNSLWPTTPSVPPPVATDSLQAPENIHLRSSKEIQGYSIDANDGGIGYVKSFIIDTQYWTIRYLEIDTRKWLLGGRHSLISPAWVTQISWPDRHLCIDLSRETLQNAPEYDENKPISREYELQLFNYYGKTIYWKKYAANLETPSPPRRTH